VRNHIEAQPASSIIINEVHDMMRESRRAVEQVLRSRDEARFVATKEE
jgi:hypothetical protein